LLLVSIVFWPKRDQLFTRAIDIESSACGALPRAARGLQFAQRHERRLFLLRARSTVFDRMIDRRP
jgi:hypothetical protein